MNSLIRMGTNSLISYLVISTVLPMRESSIHMRQLMRKLFSYILVVKLRWSMSSAAGREPPQEISDKTNGFTDDSMLTREERWDLQTNYLANVQNYNPAPQPPPSELIENLDYDDASKVCMA